MANVTLVDLAENGQLLELREKLDAGHDVNERAPDGRVALHAALAEGEVEIVALLLERGADPKAVDSTGEGLLHWAARSNRRAMLEIARDAGREAVDVVDVGGRTPLSCAAQSNDSETIDWLLEHGADPNRVDFDGWAPLHYAAADGNVEAIHQLLRGGARPLLRLPPVEGEDFGHLASDLARHFASHRSEALLILESAEADEEAQDTN